MRRLGRGDVRRAEARTSLRRGELVRRAAGIAGLLAALALLPAAASADAPSCGMRVVRDTVLTGDLTRCADGPAIVVAADHVDLDLGGHSVSSAAAPAILVEGHRDVSIHDGQAYGAAGGILVDGGRGVSIVRVLAGTDTASHPSIVLQDGAFNTVERADVRADGPSVELVGESGDTVTRVSGFALTLAGTRASRILDNQVGSVSLDAGSRANLIDGNWLWQATASGLSIAGDGNLATRNTVMDAHGDGIVVTGGRDVLERNTVIASQPGAGIDVQGKRDLLRANVSRLNQGLGIAASPSTIDAGGNRASGNGDDRQCVGLRCSKPAEPAELQGCPAVVTHDVVLKHDISCPDYPTPGTVVVAADNVTIDLVGHAIYKLFGPPIQAIGHDGVHIVNGFLRTQGNALDLSGHHDVIEHVVAAGDVSGAYLHDGGDNVMRHVQLEGFLPNPGIILEHESSDRVRDDDGDEVDLRGSTGTVVSDSEIQGVRLDASSDGNVFTRDWIAGGDFEPLVSIAGDRNTFADDAAVAYGTGGFRVTGQGNVLRRDQMRASHDDGFDISTAGNAIGGLIAVGNAALGIDAVGGTADLGGNRAAFNGDPRQCVGVVCRPLP